MWQSTFQIHDRLFTSTPYAQSLSLPNHVVPFYMVLFKAISMGHVDETRNVLDIGFDHAVYIRPVYPGVTLHQTFTIKHIKMTSNGENTLLTVGCELFNERKQLVFSVDKVMLYPGVKVPSFRMSAPPKNRPALPRSHLLDHILYNADNLSTNTNLAILNPGQLLLHSVSRCIGKSANMALSTLFRWTHPSIYNLKRYKDEELLVPGGLILAASIAASSRWVKGDKREGCRIHGSIDHLADMKFTTSFNLHVLSCYFLLAEVYLRLWTNHWIRVFSWIKWVHSIWSVPSLTFNPSVNSRRESKKSRLWR